MPHYLRRGNIPPKRHTQFRQPDGSLYHEEVIGSEGFSGISSIAYHINPPTAIERVEAPEQYSVPYADDKNMIHRHLLGKHVPGGGDWLSGRRYLLGNADVRLALCTPTEPMNYYYRNASCDELIYVHEGSGALLSPLGKVSFTAGDYVHVPRTITHQWKVSLDQPCRFLVIESASELRPPKRYRNQYGQLLEHSPYCERDVKTPEPMEPQDRKGEFEVRILKHDQLQRLIYSYHPFDVVGLGRLHVPVRDLNPRL